MRLARRDWWLLVALVVGHATVSLVHGVAHAELPVPLLAWQQGFVALVPSLAPVVALALVWRGHERAGLALFTVSMAAALLFGVVFHYLVENPDNVAAIPAGAWHGHFEWTAAAIAVSELLGTALGAWLWLQGDTRVDRDVESTA